MDVIDLQGRSGAVFRFRRVADPAALPAHAGNFILAHIGAPLRLEACGTRRSLLELAQDWGLLTMDGAGVFVRLNVSRTTRLAEHDDLLASLAPMRVLREID